jgi:hypothetical protein
VPWLDLPEGVPAFQSGYRIDDVWSLESKERCAAIAPSRPDLLAQ